MRSGVLFYLPLSIAVGVTPAQSAFPTQDGPLHLYYTDVFTNLLRHTGAYRDAFEIRPFMTPLMPFRPTPYRRSWPAPAGETALLIAAAICGVAFLITPWVMNQGAHFPDRFPPCAVLFLIAVAGACASRRRAERALFAGATALAFAWPPGEGLSLRAIKDSLGLAPLAPRHGQLRMYGRPALAAQLR